MNFKVFNYASQTMVERCVVRLTYLKTVIHNSNLGALTRRDDMRGKEWC